jgi:hypothetical protein
MDRDTKTDHAASLAAWRSILSAAAFVVAAIRLVSAQAEGQPEQKTHTLFMGADFSIGIDREFYPVRDVFGSSWVIDFKGQAKVVPTKEGPMNIRVLPALKLTGISATVADLKGERGFTFGNDPSTRLVRSMAQVAQTSDGYQTALNQSQAKMDATAMMTQSGFFKSMISDGTPSAAQMVAPLQQIVDEDANSPGADLELPANRSSPGYDAMNVTFEVSSETPLNSPYVVTMTRFHPKGTKPGTIQNLVYAKALHPIDTHPASVHLLEGGFPPDFELLDLQVHIYNRGEEVATNVSAKRVPLTRDEAFEYVKIEYVGAHKGETLPAVPAMGILPADLPRHLADGQFRETLYVKVSKDGGAGEPYEDASCTKKVADPYLYGVVRCIRFNPALAQGEPVEGVASLDLRKLKL